MVKHTFKKYYNANIVIFNVCLTKYLGVLKNDGKVKIVLKRTKNG